MDEVFLEDSELLVCMDSMFMDQVPVGAGRRTKLF